MSLLSLFQQATDPELVVPSFDLNIQISQHLNNPNLCIQGVQYFKQLFRSKEVKIVKLALSLLQTCVKNCKFHFHKTVNQRDLLQPLLKYLKRKRKKLSLVDKLAGKLKGKQWREVQNRILALIQLWADAFMMHQQQLPKFMQIYRTLRKQGLEFPQRSVNEGHLIQIQGQISPAFFSSGNSKDESPDRQKLLYSDLEVFRTGLPQIERIILLAETPNQIQNSEVKQLVGKCRIAQKKLMYLVTEQAGFFEDQEELLVYIELRDYVNKKMESFRKAAGLLRRQASKQEIQATLNYFEGDFLINQITPVDKMYKYMQCPERKRSRTVKIPIMDIEDSFSFIHDSTEVKRGLQRKGTVYEGEILPIIPPVRRNSKIEIEPEIDHFFTVLANRNTINQMKNIGRYTLRNSEQEEILVGELDSIQLPMISHLPLTIDQSTQSDSLQYWKQANKQVRTSLQSASWQLLENQKLIKSYFCQRNQILSVKSNLLFQLQKIQNSLKGLNKGNQNQSNLLQSLNFLSNKFQKTRNKIRLVKHEIESLKQEKHRLSLANKSKYETPVKKTSFANRRTSLPLNAHKQMGCGSVQKPVHKPILLNENSSQQRDLVAHPHNMPNQFPPSGSISMNSQFYFDDRELFKQSQVAFLTCITVLYDDYIYGIECQYYVDGRKIDTKRFKNFQGQRVKMPLKSFDIVNYIKVGYSDHSISRLVLRSQEGAQIDVVSRSGEGEFQVEAQLEVENRGLIGFKGSWNQRLKSLGYYAWRKATKKQLRECLRKE